MCGILYVKREDGIPACGIVKKRYFKQKDRGSEGFGYVAIVGGYVTAVERSESEKNILESLASEKSTEIIFHHRFPTSTPNFAEMAHPIVVDNPILKSRYYIVHNGVITNDTEMRTEHIKMGFRYTTDMQETTGYSIGGKNYITEAEDKFNDSESFAIDIAMFFDGKKNVLDSVGSIAFICVETNKRNKVKYIHYGHNGGNPLNKESGGGFSVLKSATGEKTPDNVIYSIDYETGITTETSVPIGDYYTKPSGYSGSSYGYSAYGYSDRDWEKDDDGGLYLPRRNTLEGIENGEDARTEFDDDEYRAKLSELYYDLELAEKRKEKLENRYYDAVCGNNERLQNEVLGYLDVVNEDISTYQDEIMKCEHFLGINI